MHSGAERFEAAAACCGPQPGPLRRSATYLAKIAVVLQAAPDKMLTFTQLMNRLMPGTCEERKCVENNVRVCLSSHKCFINIPQSRGRNYWQLDLSQITAKMLRRHFKGILELFPELSSRAERSGSSDLRPPQRSTCRAVQIRCEVKFDGPFSIESLLRRDSPSARACTASPLSPQTERKPSYAPVKAKRSFRWDSDELVLHVSTRSSADGRPQTHQLTAEHIKRRRTEARVYCSTPHFSSYTSSAPTFTRDPPRFCW